MKIKSLLSIFCALFSITALSKQKICIVIPAYNEEKRIERMLSGYIPYFENQKNELDVTFVIVANNCQDDTVGVCKKIQKKYPNLELLNFKQGGKGFALKEGYLHALKKPYDFIGFVDADMATLPQYYHDLIKAAQDCDGAIASRYAKGANVWPRRPRLIKFFGKCYNWTLRQQFHFPFKDTQCGAKIFTYDTIQAIAYDLQEKGWSCDLELLYLCQLENKIIKEVPTTWSDQPGSHIVISRKLIKDIMAAPGNIKKRHRQKALQKKKEKQLAKKKTKVKKN